MKKDGTPFVKVITDARIIPGLKVDIGAKMLFGSVLLHELGHSAGAIRHKVPVRSITLFIFWWGSARIGAEAPGASPGLSRISGAAPTPMAVQRSISNRQVQCVRSIRND